MGPGPSEPVVLCVDDHEATLRLTQKHLERQGFETITEASPKRALNQLEQRDVDCVVSDYQMPGMDGLELLQRVGKHEPGLPFLLFTGRGSEEIASEAISQGVTDYVQKGSGVDRYEVLVNRVENAVEHHRSQEALEDRRRRLETLISNLPGVVYRCLNEPSWPMESVAGECEALTGYPASALVEGGVRYGEDVIHPDDQEQVWEEVQAAVEARRAFELTYRIRTQGGETKWVWERGRGLYRSDGELESLEGFITDITERKVRQELLDQERERLNTVLEGAPMVLFAIDHEGVFTFSAGSGLDRLGLEPGEVVGVDVREVYADHPEILDYVDRVLTGETVEARVCVGDLWWQTCYEPRFDEDGAVEGAIGVAMDVTEHVEVEQVLAREREHLWSFYEIVADPDMDWDERIQALLEQGCERFGFDLGILSQIEGDRFEIQAVHGSYLDLEPGDVFDVRETFCERVFEAQEPMAFADATEVDLAEHPAYQEHGLQAYLGVPVQVEGKPFGTLNFTSPRPLSEQPPDTDRALVGILGEWVGREITRIRRQESLEASIERLEEFSGLVTHDLRTPLRDAYLGIRSARRGDEEGLDAAEGALDRMKALIEDTLTLAQEGAGVVEPVPVDVADLARQAWGIVDPEGTLELEGDIQLQADPSRLRTALCNLLQNAVDHGGPGVTVEVGPLPDGFYVEDDGPGIPDEDREGVFEAGYSTRDEGTGFGLRIVQAVVEAHGWQISVGEGAQGGARFEVRGIPNEPLPGA